MVNLVDNDSRYIISICRITGRTSQFLLPSACSRATRRSSRSLHRAELARNQISTLFRCSRRDEQRGGGERNPGKILSINEIA